MNVPALDDIAKAVLRWQHRHPLAQRLDAAAVQGIGLVALPFVRATENAAVSAAQPAWRRTLDRLRRRSAGPAVRAAFSEDFIEGLSPARAAAFALRHGAPSVEGAEGWPQRRIGVDTQRAEALPGAWPYELWLATAALDGPQGRHRVLVGLENGSPSLAVLGQRQWDLRRLAMAAAVALLTAGGVVMALRSPAPAPQEVRVTGAVVSASAPASEPSTSATPASGQPVAASASAPREPASAGTTAPPVAPTEPPAAASAASAAARATPAPAPSAPSAASTPEDDAAVPLPPASAPPFDIRPRLGIIRERSDNRPPIGGGKPKATTAAPAAKALPAPTAPGTSTTSTSLSAPQRPTAASAPERTADRPGPTVRATPGQTTPGKPVVALVSSPYRSKAEAEAMLSRMREHVHDALQGSVTPDGAVFETPEGYRAALYPFGSREEAQVINATMVARGWRTRAVPF